MVPFLMDNVTLLTRIDKTSSGMSRMGVPSRGIIDHTGKIMTIQAHGNWRTDNTIPFQSFSDMPAVTDSLNSGVGLPPMPRQNASQFKLLWSPFLCIGAPRLAFQINLDSKKPLGGTIFGIFG